MLLMFSTENDDPAFHSAPGQHHLSLSLSVYVFICTRPSSTSLILTSVEGPVM